MKHVILQAMGMKSRKYGGIERYNVELTRQLAQRDVPVIFVYEEMPESPQYIEDIETAGGEIVVISTSSPLTFCIRLWKFIRTRKVTIVHSHFTPAKHLALVVAFLAGVKHRYLSVHGRIRDAGQMTLKRKFLHFMDFHLTRVFAMSREIEDTIKRYWPQTNLCQLYFGVDPIRGDKALMRQQLGFEGDAFLFLTIGNFNHIKGFDILCLATSRLQRELRKLHAKVVIVGQEPKDREETIHVAQELGISDIIVQIDICNNVADYIVASDVYLHPSRTEATPLAIMEACAGGLPMVGSKVGGIPEIIHHEVNGLLIEPENVDELQQAMKRMVEDGCLRRAYSQGNTSIFPRFDKKNNVKKQITEYLSR